MDQSFLYLLVIAATFAAVFVLLIKKGNFFSGGRVKNGPKTTIDPVFVEGKWQEIQGLVAQQKPSSYTTAIIQADKLVDYTLKAKVGTGGTMADRIKKARKFFSNYEDYQNLWKAHKTRNMIVHETSHELLHPEVKKAISSYENALKSLKVL